MQSSKSNQPDSAGRLLTTRAAGARMSVSKATLFRAARRGDLHPVRLGGRLTRWPVADLDAWTRAVRDGRDGEV